MKTTARFVLFVAFLVLVPLASAATCNGIDLYVSAAGSDSNPGTLAEPLLTITRADQIIEARGANAGGSVIFVLPGTYAEQRTPFTSIQLRADGTPGCPITLESYDPAQPAVLHGEGTHTVVALDYANYRVVRNIVIENGTAGLTGYYAGSVIENNTIRNIRGTGNNNPSGIGTFSAGVNNDNIIRYNRIYNITTDGTGAAMNAMGIVFFQGNRNVVHNNHIWDANVGIRQKHHQQAPAPFSFTVYGNRIENASQAGISLGSSGANVTRNLIINGGDGIRIGYGDAAAVNNGFRDNSITRNTIVGASTGVNMQWGSPDQQSFDAVIRDNVIAATSRMYYVQDWENLASSDNNCYAQDSFRITTQNPTTVTTLQAQGYDASSVFDADPVDEEYRLRAGSACRGAASDGQDIGVWIDDDDSFTVGMPGGDVVPEPEPPAPAIGVCEATGTGRCFYVDPVNGDDDWVYTDECSLLGNTGDTRETNTYYQPAVNCSGGTFAQPWRTPQLAAICSGPGDVIYFMDGEYDTTCQLNPSNVNRSFQAVRSGTHENPITLKPYPGHTSVIVSGFSLSDLGSQWHIIDGLTFNGVTASMGSANNVIRNSRVYNVDRDCSNNPAGIYVSNGAQNISIINNTIHDNYYRAGGTILTSHFNCAGIKVMHNPENIAIINNTIYNEPAGIHLKYSEGNNIRIEGNRFFDNRWGIYANNNNVIIEKNLFYNNVQALRAGGSDGVLIGGQNVTIQLNTFSNNQVDVDFIDGTMFVQKNIFSNSETACTGNPTGTNGVTNCPIFISNGYYGGGFPNGNFANLTFRENCYFANTNQQIWRYGMSGSYNTYHTLEDVQVRFSEEQESVYGNPLFIDGASGDYRLRSGSPCELMGAYATAEPVPQPTPARVGDLNRDGVVNLLDVTVIIANFKRRNNYDDGADINSDGVVNIFDMVLLGKNWGDGGVTPPADTTPPAASITTPTASEVLAAGTTQTSLSVTTNEAATCRWSTTDQSYGSMPNTLAGSGTTSHTTTLTGLSNGQPYTRYVRCSDTAGNAMTSSVSRSFSVASPAAVCGNGVVESGEQCDDGGSNGACPASCSMSCTTNICGVEGGLFDINPGAGDVVVYDDNFDEYSTLAARRAARTALTASSSPFYFFDGPDPGQYREAEDSIIAPGYGGSPYAYRITTDYAVNQQPSMYAQVYHRSGQSWHFAPDDATLVVDLWVRFQPDFSMHWIKGLMMGHNFDRTQYGMNRMSASLGWANVLPQSNGREINMHMENDAADAPVDFRRWSDVADGEWHRHTMVYRRSSGTDVARDGLVHYYVDGEKLVDGSQWGLDNGWMVDRQYGVNADSTNPYPGNVGEKYTSVTGYQALLGLSDDPVISLIWPGIFDNLAPSGGGTVDLGRIRVWYRE